MARAMRVGVPGGMAAGVVMALWSMIAMWLTGTGFFTSLNLVAHTFYRSAPLNGRFSGPALVIGLAVHMTVASAFGTAIAAIVQRRPKTRSIAIVGGILFVAVVWPIMQWGVWYRIDESAAEGIDAGLSEWIFASAHLVFGMLAAGIASIGIAGDGATRRDRRQAEDPVPQPDPAPGSLFRPNN